LSHFIIDFAQHQRATSTRDINFAGTAQNEPNAKRAEHKHAPEKLTAL
jgi:hypothetical protein